MREIEFVRLKPELYGFGLGKGVKYRFEGIEDIIKERMENGCEYYGYVPVEMRGGTGDIETMSLIFQKTE